jgi:hypothetical protein
MMMRLRAHLPLLAALAWAAAPLNAAPPAKTHPARGSEYAVSEGRFAVKPPPGWTAARDAREDKRQKAYGVQLSGPRSEDGVLSTISITYYSPANTLFKGGSEEFLKRNLGSDPRFIQPAGETTSSVEKSVLAGLPAKIFTRHSHEYLPPDRTDSKEIAVVETIEVADAKAGFYVLEFKASAQLAAKLKPVYARVRSSFRFMNDLDKP